MNKTLKSILVLLAGDVMVGLTLMPVASSLQFIFFIMGGLVVCIGAVLLMRVPLTRVEVENDR